LLKNEQIWDVAGDTVANRQKW